MHDKNKPLPRNFSDHVQHGGPALGDTMTSIKHGGRVRNGSGIVVGTQVDLSAQFRFSLQQNDHRAQFSPNAQGLGAFYAELLHNHIWNSHDIANAVNFSRRCCDGRVAHLVATTRATAGRSGC